MIRVRLSPEQLAYAIHVGEARAGAVAWMNLHDDLGACDPHKRSHVIGAIGEQAVSAAFRWEWTPQLKREKTGPDFAVCGVGYEVRATCHPAGGLTLHAQDRPEHVAILVRIDRFD